MMHLCSPILFIQDPLLYVKFFLACLWDCLSLGKETYAIYIYFVSNAKASWILLAMISTVTTGECAVMI